MDFVLELGRRAKEMSEGEQEKMSDLGKALKNAAKVDYDVKNQSSEDASQATSGTSKDMMKAEKADEYLKQKVEGIKGQ
ncbi:unnamed protein product [Strongylus vulgaris]|uniref:Uncharacterized protein n=1 Tax=Strongylus vulgaris TaxID=40348 RepID=A0A3P7LIK3_STRVU|nr:unnamed protein product [Strongylus vulgaris]